jgi:hypothetical protein
MRKKRKKKKIAAPRINGSDHTNCIGHLPFGEKDVWKDRFMKMKEFLTVQRMRRKTPLQGSYLADAKIERW